MQFKDLKCNSCGGNDFTQKAGNQYRCNYCGTDNFVQQQPKPFEIKPINLDIPADAGKTVKKVMFAVVAGIIVAVVVPIIFVVIGIVNSVNKVTNIGDDIQVKIDESMGASHDAEGMRVVVVDGKEYPDTLSDRAHNPNVKITQLQTFTSGSGKQKDYYFVGFYENQTGGLIRNPRFTIEFFKDGIKINTSYPDITREYLLPGEKAGFDAQLYNTEAYNSYKIIAPTSNFGFFDPKPVVKLTNTKMEKDGSTWKISGIVQNDGEGTVYVEVIADIYDAAKKYVGSVTGYPSGNVGPGEKALFSISFDPPGRGNDYTFSEIFGEPSGFELDYNARNI